VWAVAAAVTVEVVTLKDRRSPVDGDGDGGALTVIRRNYLMISYHIIHPFDIKRDMT
jgi:hypothetical protein